MRILIAIMLFLLAGCTTSSQNVAQRVRDFYAFYLPAYAASSHEIDYSDARMKSFIASDTLRRLDMIQNIYEQEILRSDYFTYCQDYDAAWIPQLKIGKVLTDLDGKPVDVWLGIEDGKSIHLHVYLTSENGALKIFRVKDLTDNFEQNIFDDRAIMAAKGHANNLKNKP